MGDETSYLAVSNGGHIYLIYAEFVAQVFADNYPEWIITEVEVSAV